MPFTITHIAAVVPIARIAPSLPFSALAIGSMLPDAPIFFTLGYGYSFMHSIWGLLIAAVPIGLLAHYVFTKYWREALTELAPDYICSRLPIALDEVPPRRFANALAILVGASTHIAWDAFTHHGRWGVEHLQCLNRAYSIGGHSISGYELAQHGSSLVFLPLMLLYAGIKTAKEPRKKLRLPRPVTRRIAQLVIITSPVLSSIAMHSLATEAPAQFLFHVTVMSGIISILSVSIYAMARFYRPPLASSMQSTPDGHRKPST